MHSITGRAQLCRFLSTKLRQKIRNKNCETKKKLLQKRIPQTQQD
jgi:hypothetical protein